MCDHARFYIVPCSEQGLMAAGAVTVRETVMAGTEPPPHSTFIFTELLFRC